MGSFKQFVENYIAPSNEEPKRFSISEKEGWLRQIGSKKLRYVVLISVSLQWFVDEKKDYSSRLKGGIKDIRDYKLYTLGDGETAVDFKLVPKHRGETYEFHCKDHEQLETWIQAMNQAKKKRRKEERENGIRMEGKFGWLIKEGHLVKNKKERWFLLKENDFVMYYYHQEDKAHKIDPKGEIHLRDCIITDKGIQSASAFIIKSKFTGGTKDFYIEAKTLQNKINWIKVIFQRPGVQLEFQTPIPSIVREYGNRNINALANHSSIQNSNSSSSSSVHVKSSSKLDNVRSSESISTSGDSNNVNSDNTSSSSEFQEAKQKESQSQTVLPKEIPIPETKEEEKGTSKIEEIEIKTERSDSTLSNDGSHINFDDKDWSFIEEEDDSLTEDERENKNRAYLDQLRQLIESSK